MVVWELTLMDHRLLWHRPLERDHNESRAAVPIVHTGDCFC